MRKIIMLLTIVFFITGCTLDDENPLLLRRGNKFYLLGFPYTGEITAKNGNGVYYSTNYKKGLRHGFRRLTDGNGGRLLTEEYYEQGKIKKRYQCSDDTLDKNRTVSVYAEINVEFNNYEDIIEYKNLLYFKVLSGEIYKYEYDSRDRILNMYSDGKLFFSGIKGSSKYNWNYDSSKWYDYPKDEGWKDLMEKISSPQKWCFDLEQSL